MATVPQTNGTHHTLPTAADHATEALYGHASDTLQAWQTACREAAEALPAGHDAARVRKALQLAQDGAVTLHTLGLGGSVQSGAHTYRVQPDGQGCDCPDAQHRSHACKHALAVHVHREALALLWVPEPPLPAPLPGAEPPTAWTPAPQPPASGPASAQWDVHEAPISSCFRYRVGALEWTYTLRGATDAEVEQRLTDFVSTFREVVAGLDALHAEREAARQAPAASDLAALVQQAVQAALQQAPGQAALQQAPGQAAPAADDQASGVCSLHQVAMELHSDPSTGDTWRSHYDEASGRYCKGQRPSRRSRR